MQYIGYEWIENPNYIILEEEEMFNNIILHDPEDNQ